MIERRSKAAVKKDAIYRYLLWHTALGNNRNIYLAEFPKSGGTWLAQMLSELLFLPFPRNEPVIKQPCILHGHFQVSSQQKRIIHMMRDGRDVMISAYYYFLFNSKNTIQKKWIREMGNNDFRDIQTYLSKFIELFFKNYKSGGGQKNWGGFVNYYLMKENVIQVRYEDLNQNTTPTMRSLLENMNVEFVLSEVEKVAKKYSFENQTGRVKGKPNSRSFLRKGSVGDWKNYFNKESAEVFNYYAGDALIRAGYEQDKNWYR